MMSLYRALILPLLEYCCQLWSPSSHTLIRQLEAVQRSFTSRLRGLAGDDYWERLRKLRLYSLERRRERYVVIYVWKILNGYAPNLDGSDRILAYTTTRRGKLCRVPPMNRSAMQRLETMHDNSFAVQGPRLFNCLPGELRGNEETVEKFKVLLDKFLTGVPDRPNLPHYYQPASGNSIIRQLEQMRAERAAGNML